MNFNVDDANTGTLSVKQGNNVEKKVIKDINLDSLYKWYPMNINYIYRYDLKGDNLYLYPSDSPMPLPDYDYPIRERTRPIGVQVKDINPDMVCYNVLEDNAELCIIADTLDLPHMMQGNYTYLEVKKGISDLLDLYDDIREMLLQRLIDDGTNISDYRNRAVSTQDVILHSKASEEEQSQLKTFGKLYTMLNLMRKISTKRFEERGI